MPRSMFQLGVTHAAYRSSAGFRAEVQREEEQKWEWVVPKEEEAPSMPAKSAGSDDKRSVFRGAQCCSRTPPSWLPSLPAPSPSKRRTQPAEGFPCGVGSRLRQSLPQPPKRWMTGEIASLTTLMRQIGVGTQGGAEALAIIHQLFHDEWVIASLRGPLARIKVDEKVSG